MNGDGLGSRNLLPCRNFEANEFGTLLHCTFDSFGIEMRHRGGNTDKTIQSREMRL